MELITRYKLPLQETGYAIIENVFTQDEIAGMLATINNIDSSGPAFRKTNDLFAIRRFIKEVPAIAPFIFNSRLREIIDQLFGIDYFLVKSIYFDKPEQSNWFVAYHQDLTISVDQKIPVEGFDQWTVKHDQFAVQPPVALLENIFTIRIHLDDTDENNGALKIVPGSHRKGIYRPESIDWSKEKEVICHVPKGGIMIMQPLLLHASNRTLNNNKRRVIHLEFSNQLLPGGLQWAELLAIRNFATTE
jgi:hypothetical protein